MGEADDVGTGLAQAALEGESLGVVGKRNETVLAVGVIAHEDGEFAAGGKDTGAIADERLIAVEERRERRGARQVPPIGGVELLPPVRRVYPDEVE